MRDADLAEYNRLKRAEEIKNSKPANKGKKGAITEAVRDVIKQLNEAGDN